MRASTWRLPGLAGAAAVAGITLGVFYDGPWDLVCLVTLVLGPALGAWAVGSDRAGRS